MTVSANWNMDSSLAQHGYQIIRKVFTPAEIESLREEADRVAESEGSACVRRLRDKSELFSQLATSPRLRAQLPDTLIPVRSILFDKTATENWPVAWHQDLTIAVKQQKQTPGYTPWSTKDGIPHVQPPAQLLQEMLTVRIHLDDTPATNGALKIIPESHLKGKIPTTEVRALTAESAVTCACQAGDILLMSPLLLHASSRSLKPDRRRVIHFEYAPHQALSNDLEWYESEN